MVFYGKEYLKVRDDGDIPDMEYVTQKEKEYSPFAELLTDSAILRQRCIFLSAH